MASRWRRYDNDERSHFYQNNDSDSDESISEQYDSDESDSDLPSLVFHDKSGLLSEQDAGPPIKEYVNMNISSFGEAMEPITSRKLVPNLIEIAKRAIRSTDKTPGDGLTRHQSAAIRLYTMGARRSTAFYAILNKCLNENRASSLKPWYKYLNLLCDSLKKIRPARGSFWRGLPHDCSHIYNRTKYGEIFTWYGVTSCAKKLDTVEQFLDYGSGMKRSRKTLFEIKGYSGRSISHHSCYPSEDEVTFLPGTRFKLESVLSRSDILIVQLNEINYDVMCDVYSMSSNNHLMKRLLSQSSAKSSRIKKMDAEITELTEINKHSKEKLKRNTMQLAKASSEVKNLREKVAKLSASPPSHHTSNRPLTAAPIMAPSFTNNAYRSANYPQQCTYYNYQQPAFPQQQQVYYNYQQPVFLQQQQIYYNYQQPVFPPQQPMPYMHQQFHNPWQPFYHQ